MKEVKDIEYKGKYYDALVPDTLDLTERAELALNGMAGIIDPQMHYNMFFEIVYANKIPYMRHYSADVTCDPKFGEALPMMRTICGSTRFIEIEEEQRKELLSRIQDGLYWNFADADRPWRAVYQPGFDGDVREGEDLSNAGACGLMIRALNTWYELTGDPVLGKYIQDLVGGLARIAIQKDNYSYYPNGGYGEPFSYPRSGWVSKDEPMSETEGGEGSVLGYHSAQIQGLMRWYSLSGDKKAFDLAERLTRFCILPKFWGGLPDPDRKNKNLAKLVGDFLPDPPYVAGSEQGHWYSHFHARATALRGMLEYGIEAGDWRVIEFVRKAYEYTLTMGIPRIGWVVCWPTVYNLMEGCALGDLVALGMRLSDAGIADYWDDVDGVVRNHLMEGQLTRADLLQKIAETSPDFNPDKDSIYPDQAQVYPKQVSTKDVINRSLGIFAGKISPVSIPSPWSMQCCTFNGSKGLYYAWDGIVRCNGKTAQINLLLNRCAKLLDIDSYLPYEGKVVINNKSAERISVRIPSWVNKKDVLGYINENAYPCFWVGRYLLFDGLKTGDKITIKFPIKETTTSYTGNSRTKDEQTYKCIFRGSTLVDISPRDDSPTGYPLYLREHMRKDKAPMKKIKRFEPDKVISIE